MSPASAATVLHYYPQFISFTQHEMYSKIWFMYSVAYFRKDNLDDSLLNRSLSQHEASAIDSTVQGMLMKCRPTSISGIGQCYVQCMGIFQTLVFTNKSGNNILMKKRSSLVPCFFFYKLVGLHETPTVMSI